MLRACELAGRLDFTIEPASQAAIHDLRQELTKASPARVSEELVALLRCGSAGKAMQWMLDLGVLEVLLPEAYAMVQASERGLGDFGKILPTLDRKIAPAGRSRTAACWPRSCCPASCCAASTSRRWRGGPCAASSSRLLVDEVCAPFLQRFALSRVRTQQTTDALKGFLRLCEPHRTAGERHLAVAQVLVPRRPLALRAARRGDRGGLRRAGAVAGGGPPAPGAGLGRSEPSRRSAAAAPPRRANGPAGASGADRGSPRSPPAPWDGAGANRIDIIERAARQSAGSPAGVGRAGMRVG